MLKTPIPARTICSAHHFLIQTSFYPLLLSTLLAESLLAGRVYLSGSWMYQFLSWNLFLAWIPYLCSIGAITLRRRRIGRPWMGWGLALAWLAFFPNAPYIVTDFIHLLSPREFPIWYDIGLIAAFAWAGMMLAIVSLQLMQRLVADARGKPAGWALVVATAALSGIGIYLGRFLRWNSWDVLARPRALLAFVGAASWNPMLHPRAAGVTLLFGAFMLVCYLAFNSPRHPATGR